MLTQDARPQPDNHHWSARCGCCKEIFISYNFPHPPTSHERWSVEIAFGLLTCQPNNVVPRQYRTALLSALRQSIAAWIATVYTKDLDCARRPQWFTCHCAMSWMTSSYTAKPLQLKLSMIISTQHSVLSSQYAYGPVPLPCPVLQGA